MQAARGGLPKQTSESLSPKFSPGRPCLKHAYHPQMSPDRQQPLRAVVGLSGLGDGWGAWRAGTSPGMGRTAQRRGGRA